MIDAILTVLEDDATLGATLTGGVYRAVEISRQATPAAFDGNGELLPCALLKMETATPWGPHDDSGRLYVVVYFYERAGYANIEAARKRVYDLLHRVKVTPEDGSGNYDVRHGNDLVDVEDQALHVPMAMSRYVCTVQR
jgi:hypothetical protein